MPVSFAVPFLVQPVRNAVVLGLSTVVCTPWATWRCCCGRTPRGETPPGLGMVARCSAWRILPLAIALRINTRPRTAAARLALRLRPGLATWPARWPRSSVVLLVATGMTGAVLGYLWLMLVVLGAGILMTGRHRFVEDDAAR
ncbi:hypothetical protein QJS66_04130 [Kocuria rhizophila]|nr:hypothetical protein QJS66_04130 [Kocuria rhizophila]